ncbi:DHS-like NAD/FAD-binding domain-containing protein [Russula compacta]|nr:DHS-like NAD/FAD-binding domain-containing protein [Russula compacta]
MGDLIREALRLTGVISEPTQPSPTSKSRPFNKKDLPSLASYIQSDACQKIYLMQKVDRGVQANLARLNLPYPEAVFDISFFRRNPGPFYTLAKELYPGKYRPTLTHSFIKLLSDKGLLGLCFTQNIDTLERRAGIPAGKIIEAHGSFATQRCIECKRSFSDTEMKQVVKEERIPRCKSCKGLVKPDIVFFGESVTPPSFFGSIGQLHDADLLIVIGTSLTVHPFASLVNMVKGQCPRVLINLDKVGGIGSGKNDLVFLGKCDDIIRDLAKKLGWEDELDKEWAATTASVDTHEATPLTATKENDRTDGTKLDLEVEKIAESVAGALSISERDKPVVEADVSTRASSGTNKDESDKERTTPQPKTPPKTPQKDARIVNTNRRIFYKASSL